MGNEQSHDKYAVVRVITPTYRNGSVSGRVTSCNLVHLEKCIGLLPRWCSGKESACNAGDTEDTGLIPELGRLPRVGNGNPFQYSCLENSGDRGPGGLQSIELQTAEND